MSKSGSKPPRKTPSTRSLSSNPLLEGHTEKWRTVEPVYDAALEWIADHERGRSEDGEWITVTAEVAGLRLITVFCPWEERGELPLLLNHLELSLVGPCVLIIAQHREGLDELLLVTDGEFNREKRIAFYEPGPWEARLLAAAKEMPPGKEQEPEQEDVADE